MPVKEMIIRKIFRHFVEIEDSGVRLQHFWPQRWKCWSSHRNLIKEICRGLYSRFWPYSQVTWTGFRLGGMLRYILQPPCRSRLQLFPPKYVGVRYGSE